MRKWNEFIQEFRNENDNIKPNQEFKDRLSAAVNEEIASKVTPYRRKRKVIGAAAAACAVLIIGAGVYGIAGNPLGKSSEDNINSDVGLTVGDNTENSSTQKEWSYHFQADNSTENVDLDKVKAAISDNATVLINGENADEEAKQELADKLSTHNILGEASDQKVTSHIQIKGDDTWTIEEYENGDFYIQKEK